jgi:hypothetical protein
MRLLFLEVALFGSGALPAATITFEDDEFGEAVGRSSPAELPKTG